MPKQGFNVRLVFSDGHMDELPNITEIHYQYRPGRVAFESDIDHTGYTYDLEGRGHGVLAIREFEALI